MAVDEGSRWIVADYDAKHRPDICFDAGSEWPVAQSSYDQVLLMNCLYLFPDPLVTLAHARKALQRGGRLILTAPFLWHECPEPVDYYRFTRQGIRLLVEKVGFSDIRVIPYAGRFISVVDLLMPYLQRLRLFALAAQAFDPLALKASSVESGHPAHHGYVVEAVV